MKKVLITGGCSGLGHELVQLFSDKGCAVDILDISSNKKIFSENVNYIHCDISTINADFVKQLWAYDAVVCNAWISISGNFFEHTHVQEEKLFQINTFGHIELVRQLLKQWKVCTWWNISFILSATKMLPFPIALWYAASKWALDWFAFALRSFLVWSDIHVTSVYPWPMPTAHVKYYNQEVADKAKALKKVQKVAKNVFRWIVKNKRNVYPDSVSKLLWFAQPFARVLDKMMWKQYKEQLK